MGDWQSGQLHRAVNAATLRFTVVRIHHHPPNNETPAMGPGSRIVIGLGVAQLGRAQRSGR